MKSLRQISSACLALGASLAVITASRAEAPVAPPTQSYAVAAVAIAAAMREHLYDPLLIHDPAFKATEAKVAELAKKPQTRQAFVSGFNEIWKSGPFSHVVLTEAEATAAEMATYFDSMRVGGGAARLSWQDGTAVLTVDTMMGLDTIEEVHAAYEEVSKRQPKAMIIDLRKNKGGAFASKAIISHVINSPFDAGVFLSRGWYKDHREQPTPSQVRALQPWEGWSVSSFWASVQANPLVRVQLQPAAPHFSGKVYVLLSRQTASAAELTADALRASGRAVLVGETSAGSMLSQSPYDMPDGLQVFLPIADYYANKAGRIEGKGLKPDVVVGADDAMKVALEMASKL